MITIHPALAREIASAINKRSVAADMIDVSLRKRPYEHDAFVFWVKEHITGSNALIAMGIDVVTYDQSIIKECA
jgi:hypothetical protein